MYLGVRDWLEACARRLPAKVGLGSKGEAGHRPRPRAGGARPAQYDWSSGSMGVVPAGRAEPIGSRGAGGGALSGGARRRRRPVTCPPVPAAVPAAAMRGRAAAGAHGQVSAAGPGIRGRGWRGAGAQQWSLPLGSVFSACRGARWDRARGRGSARLCWGSLSSWGCSCCWRPPCPAAGPRRPAPPGGTRGERGLGCRGAGSRPAAGAEPPCRRAAGTWRGRRS